MIGTFGIGRRVSKCLLEAFGIEPEVEDVGKSQDKCKNSAPGKWTFSDLFFGESTVDHIVPTTESVFCVPAPRPHAEKHVRVLPAYTETF